MPIVVGQGMGEYCVDIVMCIDATGSMAPIINEVKDNAMSFYQRFIDSMEENDKDVAELRIKCYRFPRLYLRFRADGGVVFLYVTRTERCFQKLCEQY